MWTHTHTHTHTGMHSKQTHTWCMMGFTFRLQRGKEADFFLLPFGHLLLQTETTKRLNDRPSCPRREWSGDGTTSPRDSRCKWSERQQVQMARLYNRLLSLSLSFSCSLSGASTDTLGDLKERLISIESWWNVLKRQSAASYRERAQWRRPQEK